jgi:hypothetical protein
MLDETPKSLTAEAARKTARDCRTLMALVTDESQRIMIEHIATTWERIAEKIEEENYRS